VTFTDNVFTVGGGATSGQIFFSEHTADPTNRVAVVAAGCVYPDSFGRNAVMPIAKAYERGLWRFSAADLGDRDPTVAIMKHPDPEVVVAIV
jgi:hypothetical protein